MKLPHRGSRIGLPLVLVYCFFAGAAALLAVRLMGNLAALAVGQRTNLGVVLQIGCFLAIAVFSGYFADRTILRWAGKLTRWRRR